MSGVDYEELQGKVEWLSELPAGEELPDAANEVVGDLLDGLESGELRAARQVDGGAREAVPWVKRMWCSCCTRAAALVVHPVARSVSGGQRGEASSAEDGSGSLLRWEGMAADNGMAGRCRRRPHRPRRAAQSARRPAA